MHGEMKNTNFWLESLKGRVLSEDLSIHERITSSKLILRK
jgi:hypothetical protein